MKSKCVQETSIIGGADGPVSIFVAGKGDDFKMPLKDKIRNRIYRKRRKRAEKKIYSGAHTKEETIIYAKEKYGFYQLDPTERKYKIEKKSLKEGIIYRYRPELLGEFLHISSPDISNEKALQEYKKLLEERERRMETISDEDVPMDFQMYELKIGNGHLEMVLEFQWDLFAVSYGGDSRIMKKLKRIAQDLYLHYGVTEKDIKSRTERYMALVCALT